MAKFGSVCKFVRGPFGGSLKKSCFKEEGYAVYEQQHAIYEQFNDIRYFIDEEKFIEMSRFELAPNDLIMSCSGTMGKIAIVPDGITKGIINQALLKLTPNDCLLPDFLKLWMNSPNFQGEILSLAQGAAIKNMASVKMLKDINVPIPSHIEQQQIVDLLDKAFADIEQARTNTEKNLQNARELFDSYLQQVFSERGEDWEETNLGVISELKNGLNYTQASKGELVKIVGVKNFKDKFYISNDELETIQIDGTLSEAYHAKDGDIFIVRSNGNKALIGRSVLAKGVTGKVSHSGFTIRVRLSSSAILPSYLTHYLKSKHVHNLLIRSGEGANISSLNQKALASLPVRFPEKNEQLRLVHDIEAIQSKTMALVDVYEQKLAALDELKQSLLQQAFTGQLTQG
ncbi:restriction endonuclease subunit S [Vibrio fluvialis]|uniref:restriction endonuclease subunit S n=1 Tax=Vibrio fluvialis TaxID=676 RepID=UPI0013027D32|nr:restriction endonuclease subunit S [Vibrio fluvialis]MCE7606624.1 restriction endonuclease subunit S [Vibrio fluvialis]